jgi:tetratricopeptide (TPR) repeat protein
MLQRPMAIPVVGSLFSLCPSPAQWRPAEFFAASSIPFSSQAFSLPGYWMRGLRAFLEGRFPAAAKRLRDAAQRRRYRRRWGLVKTPKYRWNGFKRWARRTIRASAKQLWTFKGLAALGALATIFVTVYSDIADPQLNVKSFKIVGGPPGLDEGTLTEMVAQRLTEIRTRNENTAPSSDFLMFGQQLNFHVLKSEGFTFEKVVHDVEHILRKEPPEITGQVLLSKEKDGSSAALYTIRITAGGQAPYAREFTADFADISKIARAIAEQILYHEDPYLLAVYHYRNQRREQAVAVIRDYCLGNPRFAAKGYMLWGRILNDEGCPDEAIHRLKEALKAGAPSNEFESGVQGGVSRAYLANGRADLAQAAAERAVALNPKYARSYVHLGNALVWQHKYREALDNYRTAIVISPRFATPYRGKGDVFVARGEDESAIDAYQWALHLNPKEPNVHSPLARAYTRQKRYEEAIQTYRNFLDTFRSGINPKVERGSLAEAQAQIDSLETLLRQVEPSTPAPHKPLPSQIPSERRPRLVLRGA